LDEDPNAVINQIFHERKGLCRPLSPNGLIVK